MVQLVSILLSFYYVFIISTGLVGNITTIIIFSRRRLRSLRSGFFLSCLALTDLVFILILIIAFIDELNFPVMNKFVCVSTIYLSHIASFLSSNFTLAFTVHRLIVVVFPIQSTTFLNGRNNRSVALFLLIFASIFYSLSFVVTQTKIRSNSTDLVECEESSNKHILVPFLYVDTVLTFLIPFTLITLTNLLIVYKLQREIRFSIKLPNGNRFGRGLTSANSLCYSTSESSGQPRRTKTSTQKHNYFMSLKMETSRKPIHPLQTVHLKQSIPFNSARSNRTTRMLLTASSVFLLFNLPYHGLLFFFLLNETQSEWMGDFVHVARLWFYASFCVNFFVYIICGRRFRSEVLRLCRFSSSDSLLIFCSRFSQLFPCLRSV